MDLELKKSELTAEIAQVESELKSKTGELDEVRKLLGEGAIEEVYASEYDDADFQEDELDPEEDEENSDEEEPAEPDDEGYDDFEEGDEEATPDGNEELLAKEKKLSEEVLVLQMRLVALNKHLNDIVAQEGLETYVEQEE